MSEIFIKVKKSDIFPQAKQFKMNEGENRLGRKEDENDIVLADKNVSRKHSLIHVNKNEVKIEDAGSGNGTFLNGKKIKEAVSLKNGDIIKIGDTDFEVIMPGIKIEPKSLEQEKSKSDKSKKRKSFLVEIIILILVVLSLPLLVSKLSVKNNSNSLDLISPSSCSLSYMLLEHGLKFNHPPKWTRIKKVERHVFGFTYFKNTLLLFGTKYQGKDVTLVVDILDGLPSKISLDEVVDSKNEKYPRYLAHGTKYLSSKRVDINGKKAILCESEVFNLSKNLKSLEAYFVENNRRILVIAFTDAEIFSTFQPLFMHMIGSFKIDEWERPLKKPENVRLEVTRLMKSAQSLVERSSVQESNLYLGLKNFEDALILLNIYDYRDEDTLRADIIKIFKNSNEILNTKHKDLKFKIEKGQKLKQGDMVYEAAKEIINLIPDPEDQRHQDALKYYNKLKGSYSERFSDRKK